jgi:hypothetical protein
MYVSRIEADVAMPPVEITDAEAPRGSLLVGLLILAVALPYGAARLLGTLMWRDIARIGRFARLCAGAYSDALRRR